jgi:hypothetical protein
MSAGAGRWLGGVALVAALLAAAQGVAQQRPRLPPPKGATPPATPTPRVVPKFEAVAETRLLMEGLAMPNYESLEKILQQKPADVETWTFARGQALLIAETGNLLLLRPPRNQGRDPWMARAMDLRQAAAGLARAAGSQDLEGSRAAMREVAGACNRCHQTFRVAVRVGPDAPPGRKGGRGTDRDIGVADRDTGD